MKGMARMTSPSNLWERGVNLSILRIVNFDFTTGIDSLTLQYIPLLSNILQIPFLKYPFVPEETYFLSRFTYQKLLYKEILGLQNGNFKSDFTLYPLTL